MSKRWQWVLVALYTVVLGYVLWKQPASVVNLVVGVVLLGQGAWYVWRGSHRSRTQVRSIAWPSWMLVAAGVLYVLLGMYMAWRHPHPTAVEAERWCGRIWGPGQRRPDECGVDALRPMPIGPPQQPQHMP